MAESPKRSISIERDLLLEMEAYARKDHRTLSSLLIHATVQYMKRYPIKAPKEADEGRGGSPGPVQEGEPAAATGLWPSTGPAGR